MNKQQLASKIWESANKMRSKIEANEYKDYILGFIFYKFLSDNEEKYLSKSGMTLDSFKKITPDSEFYMTIVNNIKTNIGYFIDYCNLFSTWLEMENDFNVANVTDAISAFNRNINETHRNVFEKIFQTLHTGLSKLGDTSGAQTKAIRGLIELIKDIPMDGKQDYDVLGFIYEYLISNFAANAGKKAGEFYTPYEVSFLMSEIIANHLKNYNEIKIFDPTSGSGSLLINIGKSVSKHTGNGDNIKYYAQELKENTYNLTRMNLVMRGIKPSNIVTRNGDTLADDWPYFDDEDPDNTYQRIRMDAVVSNPPYSQNWTPPVNSDPRYDNYGLAPKGKADYAFLLHDLYHLEPDGIMAIVLPHGVLFRGGEEGAIRKNLIENNNIDAIIGLPANIFFGTGIPTIIMILKQNRISSDVLIIDASKGFEKVGKNNKLRASDIKKIVDVVNQRENVEKFSRVVSRDEIRQNDYNLNIPRYVDSSEKPESWDVYASMFGGIPAAEAYDFQVYWDAFPELKKSLFDNENAPYLNFTTDEIKKTVSEHPAVQLFKQNFANAFSGFEAWLSEKLLDEMESVNISKKESELSDEIFRRLADIPLVDKYEAYQILDNEWSRIMVDLEIIQTEGFSAAKKVDPNMVIKKKDGKDVEMQDGWVGRIIPFELAQKKYLSAELTELQSAQERLAEIAGEYEELIESLDEDSKQNLLNDDNDSFVAKEVSAALKDALNDVFNEEINALFQYLELSKKNDKLRFVDDHNEIQWDKIEPSSGSVFSKSAINKRINEIRRSHQFDVSSTEYVLIKADALFIEEKDLKKTVKAIESDLQTKTKSTIEQLTDNETKGLIREKWINPVIGGLFNLPDEIINKFAAQLESLQKKYDTTFFDIEQEINNTENSLIGLLDELTGSEYDMKGLSEFKKLLGGE